MELRINIGEKSAVLILIAASVLACMGIVFGYGTSTPSIMGHSWDEIECSGCIQTDDIASGAVTSSKIASVEWSKITGVPLGLDDGDDDTMITCDWTGKKRISRWKVNTRGCNEYECCPGRCCSGSCVQDKYDSVYGTCTNGFLTDLDYYSENWGSCYCDGVCEPCPGWW